MAIPVPQFRGAVSPLPVADTSQPTQTVANIATMAAQFLRDKRGAEAALKRDAQSQAAAQRRHTETIEAQDRRAAEGIRADQALVMRQIEADQLAADTAREESLADRAEARRAEIDSLRRKNKHIEASELIASTPAPLLPYLALTDAEVAEHAGIAREAQGLASGKNPRSFLGETELEVARRLSREHGVRIPEEHIDRTIGEHVARPLAGAMDWTGNLFGIEEDSPLRRYGLANLLGFGGASRWLNPKRDHVEAEASRRTYGTFTPGGNRASGAQDLLHERISRKRGAYKRRALATMAKPEIPPTPSVQLPGRFAGLGPRNFGGQ